jgi:hypothetical protein
VSKLTTITSPSGARFTVAEEHAPKFQALISDLESSGYGINAKASGGYNPRTIRGTNKPSNHAFGRAVDINWDRNARGTKGDIPAELARSLAQKHGMTWGGDWRNPDAMHFEVANAGSVPLGQRSLTAYAGVQKTQPPTTGTPQPMPNMFDVGGQAPVMDPAEVERRQKLAQILMQNGQNTGNISDWTQALGAVLNTGAGVYQSKKAADGLAKGQQSANQALAQLLMGGDGQAAMSNPYSAPDAMKFQQQQKLLNERTAAAERLQRSKIDAQNADPMRQLQMEKLRKDIAAPQGQDRVPMGYQMTPDGKGLAPIPGGPADQKLQQGQMKEAARVESIDAKIGRLEDAASDLKKHPGLTKVVGSVYGNYAPNIPGGEAANFAADLQSLKAQVAGNVIQEMRDASKTGGAVGQVTEKEWPLLMNMIASIDESQSVEQYQQRLDDLVNYAKTLRSNLRSAGQMPGIEVNQSAPKNDLKSKYGLE